MTNSTSACHPTLSHHLQPDSNLPSIPTHSKARLQFILQGFNRSLRPRQALLQNRRRRRGTSRGSKSRSQHQGREKRQQPHGKTSKWFAANVFQKMGFGLEDLAWWLQLLPFFWLEVWQQRSREAYSLCLGPGWHVQAHQQFNQWLCHYVPQLEGRFQICTVVSACRAYMFQVFEICCTYFFLLFSTS